MPATPSTCRRWLGGSGDEVYASLIPLCAALVGIGLTASARQPATPLAPLVLPAGFQADVFAETNKQADVPASILAVDDTILDLLNHPAFAAFSRLLLAWDDRT